MAMEPLPAAVMDTVFMEGLTYGPPKTEVFRQSLSTMEDAVMIAMREDYCQRQACGHSINPMKVVTAATRIPELMDLSAVTVRRQQVRCTDVNDSFTSPVFLHVRDEPRNTALVEMPPSQVITIAR
ncbi:uncharacterized protein PHALS_01139 [Plasmopara halstedii]|uniref:Uncharacterized protein n=1 Tax=Plasmopara halstedii TaxID=4781 RepID=A0A0N7L6N9_PLAHL|nr:uncharacterized protein PHALS_01139 [Plasmopara halstedii]CEG44803.1 hypothetical protein PHALS_01139 [Plasmopara halstedii]|eukprot:XP_024581172.1 hypothetical protein PHALS_01139 [Plasmopara halstedii]